MGLISDIFGSKTKPRVTLEEWRLIRNTLSGSHDFTQKELDKVEEIFRGDMYEEREIDKGIDTNELIKGIQYMRQHMDLHHISPKKVDALEIEMMKKIATS